MSVTKPSNRRTIILDRLADHVLADGLSASSLRPLAKAAQTSDRMLLYYFKDKNELVGATLAQIAARLTLILSERAPAAPEPFPIACARLTTLVRNDALWPYMRLWLELASLSASGDPLFRGVGTAIGQEFLTWIQDQVDPPTPENAAMLLVIVEGVVLLKSIGLDDIATSAIAAYVSDGTIKEKAQTLADRGAP